MIGERHFQFKRRRPKPIVLGSGITFSTWIALEFYAFEAQLDAVLQFFDRVIEPGDRNRAHTDQTVRRGGHIFLSEKLVVGAHQFAVKNRLPWLAAAPMKSAKREPRSR